MADRTNVLRSSAVWHFLTNFGLYYRASLIGRFFAAWRRSWEHSRTRVITDRVLGASQRSGENSVFYRVYCAIARALSRLGASLSTAARNSLPGMIWNSKSMHGSAIWRLLFGHTMRRFIVAVFALYLPIDWLLRDLLPIAAIASVWDEAMLIFGFLYAVFQRMCAPENEKPRITPLDTLLMAFIGLGLVLMVLTAESMSIALAGYRAVAQYMLWFFILTRIMRDDGDADAFIAILTLIGVATALHGIAQYVMGVEIPASWTTHTEVGVRTRVFSIFGSPNIMGSYLVMSAPLAASYAYRTKNRFGQIAAWAAVGVIGLACLLTFSRGAWLGFAVMVATFAWLRDKRLFALIALALGFAVMVPEVVNRITFLFTDDFAFASQFGGRAGRARDGMKLFHSSNEWLGYGLGRFGGAVAMQNQTNPDIVYFYMDNYYLKTLVEMGYLGLAGYVVLLIGTIFTGLRAAYRTKGTKWSAVTCGLLAGMVGVLTHCFTENIFEVPYMNAYFWGMAAVMLWLGFVWKPKTAAQVGVFNPNSSQRKKKRRS